MAGRLKKEATDMVNNPLDYGSAEPVDGDLYKWTAMVVGPEGTPYANGVFKVQIVLPSDYPFRAPDVKFHTKIYHPNVKSDSGEICADILKEQWKPALNLKWVLGVLKQMMEEPSADSPVEADIAALFKNDRKAFDKTAKDWTAKYAS
ncbi:hypothetical protein BASA81_005876 [Batrachochytrium salamandrivorans]|nr:hypothetical protein BASA81_005876 [Batrachochytrium salamandrivorans]